MPEPETQPPKDSPPMVCPECGVVYNPPTRVTEPRCQFDGTRLVPADE